MRVHVGARSPYSTDVGSRNTNCDLYAVTLGEQHPPEAFEDVATAVRRVDRNRSPDNQFARAVVSRNEDLRRSPSVRAPVGPINRRAVRPECCGFFDVESKNPDRDAVTFDERPDLRGSVLDGQYEVGACIGVGGTGIVFEATRLSDHETVVVKTMRPQFVRNADLTRRLLREAEVGYRVRHPGVVPVLDQGLLRDGSPYVVFRYLHSEALSRILRRRAPHHGGLPLQGRGPLDADETIALAMRLAAILHHVHRRGYVHRDIKPEHILLDRSVEGALNVSLLDFGVCASAFAPYAERDRERGRVYGTPSYVSPEQAAGDPNVDARADLFAVGVVMYECLTGVAPFAEESIPRLLRRIIREDAPVLRKHLPDVDPKLEAIVSRLLARDREQRFPSAIALMQALAPLARHRLAVEAAMALALEAGSSHPERSPTVRREIVAA